jgi:hypothetical protein
MSRNIRIAWVLVALCVCIHLLSLLLGTWVWWLDILTHLQLQYAIAGFVLTPALWFITRSAPVSLFTAGYTLCIVMWIISTLSLSGFATHETKQDIYFQNVLFGQNGAEHTSMVHTILDTPARVYAFVEPHPTFVATFAQALGRTPAIYYSRGGSSCAVFVNDATLVVQNAYLLHNRSSHDPLCIVEFETFDLYVAHPLPPLNKHRFERQNNLLAVLRGQIANSEQAGREWVVVGDFNASLYTARMRSVFQPWLNTQHYTWHSPSPLMLPIDHAFSNRPIVVHTYPALTSDHKGLGIMLE